MHCCTCSDGLDSEESSDSGLEEAFQGLLGKAGLPARSSGPDSPLPSRCAPVPCLMQQALC